MKNMDVIGRAEFVDLPDLQLVGVPAKVDTGADSSTIWVSEVKEQADGLSCIFFGPGSPFYSGRLVKIGSDYKVTRVANSFGQKELRYKVKLRLRVKGRLVNATFTLSDRSNKTYPVLLGRKLLQSKFLVDVSNGRPLVDIEKNKTKQLKQDLKGLKPGKESP